ncbi:MAG TPA: ParB/RepB/Spo0J family partition protein [Nitrospirae bacterium]|nr:ParB/RepB/Spo0J family partition protein [Nitrospirota bacterium]
MKELSRIPLNKISAPENPDRFKMEHDGIMELAQSMQKLGLIQPIVVRKKGERYEVEAGHRRLTAARSLNWSSIDAIIEDEKKEEDLHLIRAHENLIRENLNPVEEGKLVYKLVYEDGRGVEATSKLLCKSTAWVESRMDILRWPDEVTDKLRVGKITLAVAKELVKIKDKQTRLEYTNAASDYGASATVVRQWIEDTQIKNYLEQGEVASAVGQATAADMGTTRLTCGICGEYHDIDKLRHVWIDPECMVAIQELSYEIRKQLSIEPKS